MDTKSYVPRITFKNIASICLGLYFANYIITPGFFSSYEFDLKFRPKGDMQFEVNKWKAAKSHCEPRYRMVDDLLERQLLLGRTKTEVEEILGKPEITGEYKGRHQMIYHLAPQRAYPARSVFFPGLFWNVESWTLVIDIRDGKAYNVRIGIS